MCPEFRFAVVLLIAGSAVVNFRVLAQSSVEQSFKNYEIVPDVIPEAPKDEAVVTFPSGVRANLGNELTPTQVRDIPTVEYNVSQDVFYTVAFVDADVPSRANPTSREMLHWLVVNIPENNINSGETLAEYVGSGPSKGSGFHRYVFLVYQQPELLTFDEPHLNNTSTYHRTKFSIAKFAEEYNLGDPIAGDFYQAQYDDYVLVVRKQLGL